jgi:D-tyrosyl-tRNA(Tyr) deacylase
MFMLALIQRTSHASVKVGENVIGEIGQGVLALIGIEKLDTEKQAEHLLERILIYRIFEDEQGKMNLSLRDINGGLLLVPQFTLVAETHKGTRPGFSTAMPPEESKKLFSYLIHFAKEKYSLTASGEFGAHMQVSLCNDGPVTFLLKS